MRVLFAVDFPARKGWNQFRASKWLNDAVRGLIGDQDAVCKVWRFTWLRAYGVRTWLRAELVHRDAMLEGTGAYILTTMGMRLLIGEPGSRALRRAS